MACKCFTEVKERMVKRVKEALGDAVHSMDECDFGNRVWVLEKGDYCQVMLPFNVRYRKRKKNGDPEQRLTNADTKLAINYCRSAERSSKVRPPNKRLFSYPNGFKEPVSL